MIFEREVKAEININAEGLNNEAISVAGPVPIDLPNINISLVLISKI